MVFEIQSVHIQLDLSTDTSYFLPLSTNPTALGRYKHLKNPQNIFSTCALFLGAICNSSACVPMCVFMCKQVKISSNVCVFKLMKNHPLCFAQAHSEKQPHLFLKFRLLLNSTTIIILARELKKRLRRGVKRLHISVCACLR